MVDVWRPPADLTEIGHCRPDGLRRPGDDRLLCDLYHLLQKLIRTWAGVGPASSGARWVSISDLLQLVGTVSYTHLTLPPLLLV